VLQIWHKLVKRLEKKGFLPKGAEKKFRKGTYHFDIIPALYNSNWKDDATLCPYEKANKIARRHLLNLLNEHKAELIVKGASSEMVSFQRYRSIFVAF